MEDMRRKTIIAIKKLSKDKNYRTLIKDVLEVFYQEKVDDNHQAIDRTIKATFAFIKEQLMADKYETLAEFNEFSRTVVFIFYKFCAESVENIEIIDTVLDESESLGVMLFAITNALQILRYLLFEFKEKEVGEQ